MKSTVSGHDKPMRRALDLPCGGARLRVRCGRAGGDRGRFGRRGHAGDHDAGVSARMTADNPGVSALSGIERKTMSGSSDPDGTICRRPR